MTKITGAARRGWLFLHLMNAPQINGKPTQAASQTTFWWRNSAAPACQKPDPKPGDLCSACGNGRLAYDGLFVLTCPVCGHAVAGGAFT
ncbi:MAG: hypothetical protein IPM39_23345 [Chloroflexi bacterium]|nr:hypothetical protein [Chloroflexota bacterium]